MFERYTENARRALFFARYEASQLGHLAISVEHLLLGLARGQGMAERILSGRGISLEEIRRDIESQTAPGEKISTSVEIPFDSHTKHALQFAAEEADSLGHRHIGTEHLLLGTLREQESVAAAILVKRGLRLDEARNAIVKLAGDAPQRSASSHRTEASVLLRSIQQLLQRLASFSSLGDESRSLIEDIRERVTALEQQLGDRSE
jgi:ATP-dependent Clp protease ATP-binding subunit ClpC